MTTTIRHDRHRGFSLIEMLTVISVIAVLIALLLPALGRTREAARRAVCASNQRGLVGAALQYAADHRGTLPVGYQNGHKQTNYVIRYITGGGDPDWGEMGWLWASGLLANPMWQYCPSNSTGNWRSFDTDENPWPPDEVPAGAGVNVRSGYDQRPMVNHERVSDGVVMDGQPASIADLPSKAVFSDPVTHRDAWGNHDWDGINTAYADGAVHFVAAEAFADTLDAVPGDEPHQTKYNDDMLTDDGESGVWADLDRAR